MLSFSNNLALNDLSLVRKDIAVLQVNIGLACNQTCKHCHLDAGPDRSELMPLDVMDEVISVAQKIPFQVIDITGGAPELNPLLIHLLQHAAELAPRVILRSNLTTLSADKYRKLAEFARSMNLVIVGSLPAVNLQQAESQRGSGTFEKSLDTLRILNDVGYGVSGGVFELDLVCNPAGAFLPANQEQLEEKFRQALSKKWNVSFSHLYTFANAPLGRYRKWLVQTENFEDYMAKLASSFNPCTLESVMCRNLISVSWDGFLFDCDFNQAAGLPSGNKRTYITDLEKMIVPGLPIAVADHCYACTAGAGFT